eukprot:6197904-Pleurochrysis_carterae.AAC.1
MHASAQSSVKLSRCMRGAETAHDVEVQQLTKFRQSRSRHPAAAGNRRASQRRADPSARRKRPTETMSRTLPWPAPEAAFASASQYTGSSGSIACDEQER